MTSSDGNTDQPVIKLVLTLVVFAGLAAAFWFTADIHPNLDGSMAEATPDAKLTRINLPRKLADQGRDEEAIAQYELLARHYPKWTDPRVEVVAMYLKNRDFDNATKNLQAIRSDDVNYNTAQKELGLVEALNDKEFNDGWEDFKRAVDREIRAGYPAEVESRLKKAGLDMDKPLIDIKEEQEKKPDKLSLKLAEVQLLIARKKLPEAKKKLDALADTNQKSPEVQLELAELALWKQEATPAQAAFRNAVKLTKEGPSADAGEDSNAAAAKTDAAAKSDAGAKTDTTSKNDASTKTGVGTDSSPSTATPASTATSTSTGTASTTTGTTSTTTAK